MSDPDARAVLASELMPGERVLWAGRPQGVPFNSMGVLGTVMGAVFIAIGVVWIIAAIATGNTFQVMFMSVWTAIAGWNTYVFSGLLRGPASQSYALTDRRGIVVETMGRGRRATLGPQDLRTFERSGGADVGTLSFGTSSSVDFLFRGRPRLPLDTYHKIPKPADVGRLILETFSGATP